MKAIHPPVPVGYIDGSLDTEGLDDDERSEYIEHAKLAQLNSGLRKKANASRKHSIRSSKLLDSPLEKEHVAGDCEGIACCKTGNWERLLQLIETGWEISTVDKHGSNGLHWAAGAGHLKILETLVSHGLNINSANRSLSPSHQVVRFFQFSILFS
jgi:ankyrin repeat protein